ncbi:hypothetical protein EC973_003951 [Apophysomyces ossiformis]|uniref:Uncharacterized protein n=1 Tax=Apophysomyces ossiformis TaxID=679940 RepID=A0A8H7BF55_9FUNG|nr:hypothetical protein EC973_003951 [Apophysomyces ossiformis]
MPYRAALNALDNDLTKPATVFTLCDLPQSGYGSSTTAIPRLGSQILEKLTIGMLTSGKVSAKDFKAILQLYNGKMNRASPEKKAVATLPKIVEIDLASQVNKAISAANANITVNIEERLHRLYK